MLLEDKVAVIYGAGGAIGGAVARRFAMEGAKVYLSGRNVGPVETVANAIIAAGGSADVARVDALDEVAVETHAERVAERAGRIDIVFNAVDSQPVQGRPLAEMAIADFTSPIVTWTTTQLLTARAAARHMARRRSGVILTLSASPARLAIAMTGGFAVACAAVEALSRTLAAELGQQGIRVICLRSHRIADTLERGTDWPLSREDFRHFVEDMTILKRLPTLDEVAGTAAFLASDQAGAMTATVANLTCGMSVD